MTLFRRTSLGYLFAVVFFCNALNAQSPQAGPAEPVSGSSQSASQRTAQQRDDYRKAMEQADQKLADEVKAHSELMKNLEYLTTQIGPRLTGSPQMQAASDWTLKRFHDYGIDAHLETAQINHGWTRGAETAEITSPIQRRIQIHAFGWSKATNGEISGKIVTLNIQQPNDFDQYKGKLKGLIVLVRKPADLAKNDPNPLNAYDAVIPPARGVPGADGGFRGRMQLMRQVSAEQPALVLLDSGKPDSLFTMTSSFRNYQLATCPWPSSRTKITTWSIG